MLKGIFQLIRIKHWSKNSLLFFPLLFAGQITDLALLTIVALGFLAFSFMASAVYCLNDISDADLDAQHPLKKHRPIANGTVSKNAGYLTALFLVACSLLIAVYLHLYFVGILVAYLMLNLAYSSILKHIPILDVTSISLGFILRIFGGGIISATPISHWLVLMTFLLSIFLALGKRRYDLNQTVTHQLKGASKGYTPAFVDTMLTLFGSVTLVSYISYVVSPDVTQRIGSDYVYLTCLPVLLGLMRYLQILIVDNQPADPVELLSKDLFLQSTVAIWLITFIVLLYT